MEVIVGGAEIVFAFVGQRLSGEFAPVIPSTDDDCLRPHAEAAHRLFESEALQDSRCVGAYLDAGADLAEVACLFEDLHVVAGALEGKRGGEAADSCSDYYDSHGPQSLRTGGGIRLPGTDRQLPSCRLAARGGMLRGG